MCKDAQPPTGGSHRPRNPQASPLYQCVRRHRDVLDAAALVHRPVETEVLQRFADGVFLPSGAFRVLPPLPEAALCDALRHKVLDFLRSEGVLDTGLAQRMLLWRHSGFSLHNRVRGKADDAAGRQRLARYMIRCPFALEKMRYDDPSDIVFYRSKLHATLKRNYQLMPALKWQRLLNRNVTRRQPSSSRGRSTTGASPTGPG